MTATKFNRTDIIPLATGYKYLPQSILLQIELRELKRKGELDDNLLIETVNKFDVSYQFSDQASTWRAGNSETVRITNLINESDYSDADKKILAGGLVHSNVTLDAFAERFPVVKIENHKYDAFIDLFESGEYDERRLLGMMNSTRKLCSVMNLTGKYVNGRTVWTKHTPKFVFKTTNKVTVSKEANAYLEEQIATGFSKADIHYLNVITMAFSTCVNVGTSNGPNFQSATTLPYFGIIQTRTNDDLGEYTNIHYRLGGDETGYDEKDDYVSLQLFTKDNIETFFDRVEYTRAKKAKAKSLVSVVEAVEQLQCKFA
jgi:hypothetical protein